MFKRTILLVLLVGITAVSVVFVVAVVQAPPRRDGGDSSSGGFFSRRTATASGRAAGQARSEEPQGVDLEDIQARIRASDEEWKVIGPKLRRLMMAYAAAETSLDESSIGGTDDPGFAPPGRGGPGDDSFSGPGSGGPFGRGGPGRGGFDRGAPGPDGFGPGGPRPEGFGPGGPGPDGFGFGPGPGGFGRGGRGPGGFGRGGPGPGGGPPGFGGPSGAVTQKLVELRTALTDPNTTSEQLREKIGAVRDARLKVKAELAAARKDLLELLTPDQEAVLVSLDYLD